jgi:hypothetical protein
MKILLKQPGLRGMRAAVLATSLACAAASATLVLPTELHASVRMSALPVALDTAASLIALLAAFLVVGRFARRTQLNELMLVCALAVLALSDLMPTGVASASSRSGNVPARWAASCGSLRSLAVAAR